MLERPYTSCRYWPECMPTIALVTSPHVESFCHKSRALVYNNPDLHSPPISVLVVYVREETCSFEFIIIMFIQNPNQLISYNRKSRVSQEDHSTYSLQLPAFPGVHMLQCSNFTGLRATITHQVSSLFNSRPKKTRLCM